MMYTETNHSQTSYSQISWRQFKVSRRINIFKDFHFGGEFLKIANTLTFLGFPKNHNSINKASLGRALPGMTWKDECRSLNGLYYVITAHWSVLNKLLIFDYKLRPRSATQCGYLARSVLTQQAISSPTAIICNLRRPNVSNSEPLKSSLIQIYSFYFTFYTLALFFILSRKSQLFK